MLNIKITALLFTAICYSHVRHCHGTVQEVKKSYTFDDKIVFGGADSFSDGIYVYVLCDSDTGNTSSCKVIQMKYPYEEISKSCAITLGTRDGSPAVGINVLGKEKAILYWLNPGKGTYNTSISTVDFQSCEFSRAINIHGYLGLTFLELVHMSKVVPYNDGSFDIFYQDPRYHPEKGELYKMRISGDGKIKTQSMAVDVERGRFYYAFSAASGSPSKGYVYVKRNQMNYSKNATYYLLLVKPDGTKLKLLQYHRFHSRVSVGNDLISLCYEAKAAESEITCNQYDENGNVRFSTVLHIGSNIDFIEALYNPPDGGLLVMYSAKDCNKLGDCYNIYKVMKIGSNGKKIGILQLFKVDTTDDDLQIEESHVYMDESSAYCATLIHWNYPTIYDMIPSDLKFLSKCFTVQDIQISGRLI